MLAEDSALFEIGGFRHRNSRALKARRYVARPVIMYAGAMAINKALRENTIENAKAAVERVFVVFVYSGDYAEDAKIIIASA